MVFQLFIALFFLNENLFSPFFNILQSKAACNYFFFQNYRFQ